MMEDKTWLVKARALYCFSPVSFGIHALYHSKYVQFIGRVMAFPMIIFAIGFDTFVYLANVSLHVY